MTEHLRDGVPASSLVIKNLEEEQVEAVIETLNTAIEFFNPKEIRQKPTASLQMNGLYVVKMRCWL